MLKNIVFLSLRCLVRFPMRLLNDVRLFVAGPEMVDGHLPDYRGLLNDVFYAVKEY